ncbi:MAG: hypothetical protein WCQ20_00055 [Synechococcaceae cyanobacterium ELA739]|jgi:hypothetical protein
MFRRLLNRIRRGPEPMVTGVNLVTEETPAQLAAPANIGITQTAKTMAWTVSRLDRIVRRAQAHPGDAQSQLEARHARHCLSQFWLQAPIDQLESLYGGPIGQTYRLVLQGPLPAQPLADDESHWKQSLAKQLETNFEAPERLNLLLAVMTYCAPGKMQLSKPAETLPRWLLGDYVACFAPELASELGLPIGLLDQPRPASSSPSAAPGLPHAVVSAEPAPLPRLIPEPGGEVFGMFQDEQFVNRMTGLINLYLVDRDDAEVKLELARLRRLIGQIWLDVSSTSLEPLYRTSLGSIYQSLLASNFGAEPLDLEDQQLCQGLTAAAVDMGHPAMAQALLATMPFLPQGKMRLGPGQSRLPLWLQESFNSLAGLG